MTSVSDAAPTGEGQTAEPPERRCARCGAVGTHYLTCPCLRLPSGYRLGEPAGDQHTALNRS